jgi:hypothetical protein
MSDRLQELLRQKALLAEHSAWLEREIAVEQALTGGNAGPALPAPLPLTALMPAAAAPAPAAGAAAAAEADAILAQYRDAAKDPRQQVKWGCILYVAAGIAVVALAILLIYVLARRH